MSDARLRELERRWRETGASEDEASCLRERLRAGQLTPERLELAARCAHPAARLVAGPELPLLEDLVAGLPAWGPEPAAIACLVVVALTDGSHLARLPRDERLIRVNDHESLRRALQRGPRGAIEPTLSRQWGPQPLRRLVERIEQQADPAAVRARALRAIASWALYGQLPAA